MAAAAATNTSATLAHAFERAQTRREAGLLHTDFEVDQLRRSHAQSNERERQRRRAERKVQRQREHLLRARVLERVDVFRAGGLLSRALLRRVAAAMRPATYAAGETIVEEGAPGDALFVVTEGKVDFFQRGRKINSLGKDDYFGEVSLLDVGARSRRTATAIAATDVSTLSLHRVAFRRLFPDAAEAVSVAFSGWFYGDVQNTSGHDGDGQQITAQDLPPALEARRAMRRRSITFREADAVRASRAQTAAQRWRVGADVIRAARYMRMRASQAGGKEHFLSAGPGSPPQGPPPGRAGGLRRSPGTPGVAAPPPAGGPPAGAPPRAPPPSGPQRQQSQRGAGKPGMSLGI